MAGWLSDERDVGVVAVGVFAAVVMAVVAAVLFAVAAVAQNGAVAAVVERTPSAVLGGAELRALAHSRIWLGGISLTAIASVIHAGALILAPVAVVQPVGVLSVPFAVVIAARRTRMRPPAAVLTAVVICLLAVAGFVMLAESALGSTPRPRFLGVLAAALTAAAVVGLLMLWALGRTGWMRCVGFAAAGATAFGLVSALMRLISLNLTTGVNDLDDVGVWLPAGGIVAALLVGGWAVQQAHAAGAPAVVVGCLTVIDPLVAVVLGITMLGEGGTASSATVLGLIGFAALALSAAILLASRHPAAQPPIGAPPPR
jgi:hypothetical protein